MTNKSNKHSDTFSAVFVNSAGSNDVLQATGWVPIHTELGWGMGGQSQCRRQGWLSHFKLCHHSYHNFTPSLPLSRLVPPLWNTSAPWRIYLWFLIVFLLAYLSQLPPPFLFPFFFHPAPFSLLLLISLLCLSFSISCNRVGIICWK